LELTTARATCQKLGGDLAQIQTIYNQKAVAKFLTDNFASGTGNEWWIGALRDGKRKWRWVDGDKVSKDIGYKWDKDNLGNTNEKCLSIHSDSTSEFCAGKCHDVWEFVCETGNRDLPEAGPSIRRDLSNLPNVLAMPMAKVYSATTEKKTWDQARATCQKIGGDLAQIRTVYDQKAMAKFLTDTFTVRSWETSTEWWIGAVRERSSKRKWRWVDGDKVS